MRRSRSPAVTAVLAASLLAAAPPQASAQTPPASQAATDSPGAPADRDAGVFRLGEVVTVVGTAANDAGIGGPELTAGQMRTFDKTSLDQAVNLVPGVSSSLDANGRRNESDIFVRGFGRWQVPLMIDGVRVYLPADNRLDFGRFLTEDVAAVQIRKGYASVLDGPGAMGGSINLVTRTPVSRFETEAGISTGGCGDAEGWNGFARAGTRQRAFYAQGNVNYADRDFWSLSNRYTPPPGSLQPSGRRLASDSRDWRVNAKVGLTPTATSEYTFNITRQSGAKGAPLNVVNNPPVPPNSFWRWPRWDLQNTAFLTSHRVGQASYVRSKLYYNTFRNDLDAFDDGSYATQASGRAFHSPYDDSAFGGSVEIGSDLSPRNTLKSAVHYRNDRHREQQVSRPGNPAAIATEPPQDQSQYTWSVAIEDTHHATPAIDLVGGISYDRYAVTKAEEFEAGTGVFEYPKGGADAFNWQAALVWRHDAIGEMHVSVSDRSRFPVFFELYSTRFGTATPNPNLGPERAINLELGWAKAVGGIRLSGAVFYSDVRRLIQTVVLPDSTTQTQNVGDGHFQGVEVSADAPIGNTLRVGGNYTAIRREIADALQPELRPTGVPSHKAFVFASWQPIATLVVTPGIEVSGDRWSDRNPPVPLPFVRTGAYQLFNVDATWSIDARVDLSVGMKNLGDQHYELAWGLPQPGRSYYVKSRMRF